MRKANKKQLSLIKKQRLFEQKVAKARIRRFKECYQVLSQEIEETLLKGSSDDLTHKILKIVDNKFTRQLKLALNTVAELNINAFVDFFIKFFERSINLEDLQIIKSKMLHKFLMRYTAESVTSITHTTKEILRTRIAKYTEQGLSFRDIVKNIVADTNGEIGKNRATIIARVETSKAFSITNYETAVQSGLKYKTWWYIGGGHENRKYHQAMNGKRIPIKSKFDVQGEGKVPPVKMRFPKDPECRVAGQVINCTCQIIYN